MWPMPMPHYASHDLQISYYLRASSDYVVDVVKAKLTLPEQHLTKAVTSYVDCGVQQCSIVRTQGSGSG
jgi:hypothetical protein